MIEIDQHDGISCQKCAVGFEMKFMDSMSVGYILFNDAIDHNYQLHMKEFQTNSTNSIILNYI